MFVTHQAVERIGVARELPLAAVAEAGRCRTGEALRPVGLDFDPLDRIRGGDRLDLRLPGEATQKLWNLILE